MFFCGRPVAPCNSFPHCSVRVGIFVPLQLAVEKSFVQLSVPSQPSFVNASYAVYSSLYNAGLIRGLDPAVAANLTARLMAEVMPPPTPHLPPTAVAAVVGPGIRHPDGC